MEAYRHVVLVLTVMDYLHFTINKGLFPQIQPGVVTVNDYRTFRTYKPDSLCADPLKIPLTDAQAKELDRRLDEMEKDTTLRIPWENVLAQIREGK